MTYSINRLLLAKATLLTCIWCVCLSGANATLVHDFNLVVFGDLDTQSEVEGKVFVGGNLTGTAASIGVSLSLPGDEAALVVGGNVSATNLNVNAGAMKVGSDIAAGTTVNMNSAGNYEVDGAILGNVNNGSVGTVTGVPTLAEMQAYYGSVSSQLAALAPNSTLSVGTNQALFAAEPSILSGLAVFSVTAAEIFELPATVSQVAVAMNNADGIVINVLGTNITVPSNLNGVGGLTTDEVRERVVWNFPEAQTLAIEPNFHGAILAPHAALTNSTALDGQVIVDSFVQRGEVHLPISTQLPVPEPTSAMLAAMAGLLAVGRRQF